jgi:hypothetical protein
MRPFYKRNLGGARCIATQALRARLLSCFPSGTKPSLEAGAAAGRRGKAVSRFPRPVYPYRMFIKVVFALYDSGSEEDVN